MAQAARNHVPSLNSWKEIATHLDRGVRTVQRWERDLNLPVHRLGKGKRSPVYALVPELNFWIATSGVNSAPHPFEQPITVAPNGNGISESPLEISRRLMAESLKLVRTVAETSVRQQRETEILQERIREIRSRMDRH